MNEQEFRNSMARILSFHNAPKTPLDAKNLENYLASLYEAVGRMDAFTFERVCKDLANNMGRGQKPMPSQFWAVYQKLRGEEIGKKIDECAACKSTGWVYQHMVEASSGLEGDFAVPCPECRKHHPLKDAEPRSGWTFQDVPTLSHEARLLKMAENMGPKGARFVLDLADKFKVNFHDHVILELVKKAGDEPPSEPNKAVEGALSVLHREPVRETAPAMAAGGIQASANPEQYEIEE